MQAIDVVNNNQRTQALLIPKVEWIRLKKILTKKDDDIATIEMIKRLKDERQATSKAIKESWDATVLTIHASRFLRLKERENIKRDNDIKLREEGKAELQRIANEIEEDREKKKAKALATRENLINHLNENRKIVAENIKLRQLEDQEENLVVSIMAEAKKKIAKTRKLKEIEILKEKQKLLEKMVETANTGQDKEEVSFQNAVEEKERKYQREELKNKGLIKNREEDFEASKKILDEENRKEKERLTLSHQWELERRLRETEMLCLLEESSKQAKTRETNCFRKNLNLQCDNNRAATRANKLVDVEKYNAQLKLWKQQDEEFMTHTKNMITKYKKAGISVIPLMKAIEDYKKKNKLLSMQ
ncbi:unnamed protein product [Macrosiphum euphorbiae]|uniref:Trichohyalin-plectin-homology domain-containing protein n=1 Tax=Macrosiphum euphorbiae TaxID=13131 RepID=A0AAV0Y843_9HEMI|nr:unnamed protein product [Macrosiphum euphorbiae]